MWKQVYRCVQLASSTVAFPNQVARVRFLFSSKVGPPPESFSEKVRRAKELQGTIMPLISKVQQLDQQSDYGGLVKEIAKLSQAMAQELVLEYVNLAVYKGRIRPDIMDLSAFKKLLANFPEKELDLLAFFLISEIKLYRSYLLRRKKPNEGTQKEIQEEFHRLFKSKLPKIAQGAGKQRAEAILKKNYALYLYFSGEYRPAEQKKDIFEKAKEFTLSAMQTQREMFQKQYQQFQRVDDNAELDTHRNLKKQNLRKLIEIQAEGLTLVHQLNIGINKEKQASRADFKQFLKMSREILIRFTLLQGIKPLSLFYHRLKKIHIYLELELSESKEEAHKVCLQQLEQLVKEAKEHFLVAKDHEVVAVQLVNLTLQTKMELLRLKDEALQKDQLRQVLAEDASDLVSSLSSEEKDKYMQPISKIVKKILRDYK